MSNTLPSYMVKRKLHYRILYRPATPDGDQIVDVPIELMIFPTMDVYRENDNVLVLIIRLR
jgi:hypothetical protein